MNKALMNRVQTNNFQVNKELLHLHRNLFLKLFWVDALLIIVGQFYIFGRDESFIFVPNMGYIITLFLLFLTANISLLRRYLGTHMFYLHLPICTEKLAKRFLGFRLGTFLILMIAVTTVLLMISPSSIARCMTYSLHIFLFGGVISVSSLPLFLLQEKSHPVGILLSLVYFIAIIPIWLITLLCSELLFSSMNMESILNPLLFLILTFVLSIKVVNAIKV